MVIERVWQPYVSSDNRLAQTLAGVTEKDSTHAHVTAKERRLNEDSTPTQSRWSTMKAWSTMPELGRERCEHTLSIHWEYSIKIVSGHCQGWYCWHLGFSFAMSKVGIRNEITRHLMFWPALGICVFQVAGDYKYHPECFVCLSCRVVIEDQDTYALVERTKLYWWVTSHFSTPNFTCIYRLYWCRNFTHTSSRLY